MLSPPLRPSTPLRVAALVGASLVSLACAGCCASKSPAQTRTEAVTGQQRVSKKLATIRAALASAPSAGKTTCPASLAHAPYVLTADDSYLSRFSASGAVASTPADPLWDFMQSRALRVFRPETEIGDLDASNIRSFVQAFEQRRYVVVFTDAKRKPAKFLVGSNPPQFDGGSFDGMMRVFDSETGKLLCQAPVKARTNDDVTYFDKGLLATNPQEAVSADFGSQLTKAARVVFAEIAPGLHIQIPQ